MSAYADVEELFHSSVGEEYLGEDITLVEHMIQCGELAIGAGAPDWLVVAALLHDIGHMLVTDAHAAQDAGVDLHHDEVGAEWIANRFPENVFEAVRLHVDAKRYLVSTDPSYIEKLSDASRQTFEIQGAGMDADEIAIFRSLPYSDEAIQLRLWDDLGKIRGASTLTIKDFQKRIENVEATR
jgi:predicted HD phosphohydrolase